MHTRRCSFLLLVRTFPVCFPAPSPCRRKSVFEAVPWGVRKGVMIVAEGCS